MNNSEEGAQELDLTFVPPYFVTFFKKSVERIVLKCQRRIIQTALCKMKPSVPIYPVSSWKYIKYKNASIVKMPASLYKIIPDTSL